MILAFGKLNLAVDVGFTQREEYCSGNLNAVIAESEGKPIDSPIFSRYVISSNDFVKPVRSFLGDLPFY